MALSDYLPGRKAARRELAGALVGAIHAPIQHLHNDLIVDAGAARFGEHFGPMAASVLAARDDPFAIPRETIRTLLPLITDQLAAIRPVHEAIGQGMTRVIEHWPHGGFVTDAADRCRRGIELFWEAGEPRSHADRAFRLFVFLDIDEIGIELLGALTEIAGKPGGWARPG